MSDRTLAFVYLPSHDVAADVAWARDGLGARPIFAIDAMGTRVAMVELGEGSPRVLFADHLGDASGLLVYRVGDLAAEAATMADRGWGSEASLELPMGPCRTFRSPGGTRVAFFQEVRPEVIDSFRDRFDF
jgi:hypothetical protein